MLGHPLAATIGELVLGHPLAATIGDSARCMQNLEKVLFTGPKTSDTVTFICD